MKYKFNDITIETKYNNSIDIFINDKKHTSYIIENEDYVELSNALNIITSKNSLLSSNFDRLNNILDQFNKLNILETDINNTWQKINDIYLKPYRILLTYSIYNQKQRKLLRYMFKPIYYLLCIIKNSMERELDYNIPITIDKVY